MDCSVNKLLALRKPVSDHFYFSSRLYSWLVRRDGTNEHTGFKKKKKNARGIGPPAPLPQSSLDFFSGPQTNWEPGQASLAGDPLVRHSQIPARASEKGLSRCLAEVNSTTERAPTISRIELPFFAVAIWQIWFFHYPIRMSNNSWVKHLLPAKIDGSSVSLIYTPLAIQYANTE